MDSIERHYDTESVDIKPSLSDLNYQIGISSSNSDVNTSPVTICSTNTPNGASTQSGIKSSNYEKLTLFPGLSYVLIVVVKSSSKQKILQYDCVMCSTSEAQILSAEDSKAHLRSRSHLLNILELENYQLYEKYRNDESISTAKIRLEVLKCQSPSEKIVATSANYDSKRSAIVAKILQLRSTSKTVCEKLTLEKETSTSEQDVFTRTDSEKRIDGYKSSVAEERERKRTSHFEQKEAKRFCNSNRREMFTSEQTTSENVSLSGQREWRKPTTEPRARESQSSTERVAREEASISGEGTLNSTYNRERNSHEKASHPDRAHNRSHEWRKPATEPRARECQSSTECVTREEAPIFGEGTLNSTSNRERNSYEKASHPDRARNRSHEWRKPTTEPRITSDPRARERQSSTERVAREEAPISREGTLNNTSNLERNSYEKSSYPDRAHNRSHESERSSSSVKRTDSSEACKILVIGHSWASQLKKVLDQNDALRGRDEVRCVSSVGAKMQQLEGIAKRKVTCSTDIVIILGTMCDAYSKGPPGAHPQLIVPNEDFDPHTHAREMFNIVAQCRKANKRCKVIFLLPPMLDLIQAAIHRVENWEEEVKRYYDSREDPREILYHRMKRTHLKIQSLISQDYKWTDKFLFNVQDVACRLIMNMVSFESGQIITLGGSFLVDGIHPHDHYLERIWERMQFEKYLQRLPQTSIRSEMATLQSRRPISAPHQTLGLSRRIPTDIRSQSFPNQPNPRLRGKRSWEKRQRDRIKYRANRCERRRQKFEAAMDSYVPGPSRQAAILDIIEGKLPKDTTIEVKDVKIEPEAGPSELEHQEFEPFPSETSSQEMEQINELEPKLGSLELEHQELEPFPSETSSQEMEQINELEPELGSSGLEHQELEPFPSETLSQEMEQINELKPEAGSSELEYHPQEQVPIQAPFQEVKAALGDTPNLIIQSQQTIVTVGLEEHLDPLVESPSHPDLVPTVVSVETQMTATDAVAAFPYEDSLLIRDRPRYFSRILAAVMGRVTQDAFVAGIAISTHQICEYLMEVLQAHTRNIQREY